MNNKEKKHLVSEVNILREMKNSHIVRYVDRIIEKDKQMIKIVMEYCKGGDMAQLIKNAKSKRKHIDEDLLWRIFAQIVQALNYYGERNVKLGDFGLSRELGEESVFAKTHVGTPYYMSPEQMSDDACYNEKSDIWSLGCVIYEIASLSPPFKARNQMELGQMIRKCKLKPLPPSFSDELFNLIKEMIQIDASKRPSTDDLKTHPRIVNALNQVLTKKKEKEVKKSAQTVKSLEDSIRKREMELEMREQNV